MSDSRDPGDILPAVAAVHPDKTALVTATRTLTFTEFGRPGLARGGRAGGARRRTGLDGVVVRAQLLPAEIERVTAGHPTVSMVAVGPVVDEVKGELACAYGVLRDGADPTAGQLIDYTRDKLAAYKRPRSVVFVPSLPATSTGKIMSRKLAEMGEA